MNTLFNFEGPLWQFLAKLGDMIILHVLWGICSLPVVTFGAATTAAHYVALKLVKDEGGTVWSMFFKSFRLNLKQGCLAGVIDLLVGAFLFLDLYLCLYRMEAGETFRMLMLAALGFLLLLYFIENMYFWPVLARFDNTLKQTAVNAFMMAFSNMKTTVYLVIQNVILLGMLVGSVAYVPQIAVLFMIFGAPLFMVLNCMQIRYVLERYMPERSPVDKVAVDEEHQE